MMLLSLGLNLAIGLFITWRIWKWIKEVDNG